MKDWVIAVKAAMEARGVTVAQLAERTGCARGHMYRILKEEQTPTLSKAVAISSELGLRFEIKGATKKRRIKKPSSEK